MPFEGEGEGIEDGLIAEVEPLETKSCVEVSQFGSAGQHRDAPALAPCAVDERSHRSPHVLGRADRVCRDQAEVPEVPVAEHRFAFEEVILVLPQGEVGECVGTVASDERTGSLRVARVPTKPLDDGSEGHGEARRDDRHAEQRQDVGDPTSSQIDQPDPE